VHGRGEVIASEQAKAIGGVECASSEVGELFLDEALGLVVQVMSALFAEDECANGGFISALNLTVCGTVLDLLIDVADEELEEFIIKTFLEVVDKGSGDAISKLAKCASHRDEAKEGDAAREGLVTKCAPELGACQDEVSCADVFKLGAEREGHLTFGQVLWVVTVDVCRAHE